jgi:hypothetical protein
MVGRGNPNVPERDTCARATGEADFFLSPSNPPQGKRFDGQKGLSEKRKILLASSLATLMHLTLSSSFCLHELDLKFLK